MKHTGRTCGNLPALFLVLPLLPLVGCGAQFFTDSFQAKEPSPSLPPATMVAVGEISTERVVSDTAVAAKIRRAIYLELVERQATYSVRVQDIVETDRGNTDADIVLVASIDKEFSGGVTAMGSELAGGGGEQYQDGRFSLWFGVQERGGGKKIWNTTIWKAGRVSDPLKKLRRGIGSKVASQFPYKKK